MQPREYILFMDYGTEGWKPKPFPDREELLEYIRSGNTCGSAFRIYQEVFLTITEPKGGE